MAVTSNGVPGPPAEPFSSMDEDAGNEDMGPNMISCDTHTEVSSK